MKVLQMPCDGNKIKGENLQKLCGEQLNCFPFIYVPQLLVSSFYSSRCTVHWYIYCVIERIFGDEHNWFQTKLHYSQSQTFFSFYQIH